MLCAAIDPAHDYRWHALRCGGPATSSFLCEMKGNNFSLWNISIINLPTFNSDLIAVPDWAFRCTTNVLATNTVYDTETGNLHLVRECDRKLVKIAVCNSKTSHHEVERELSCLLDEQERFDGKEKVDNLSDLMEPQSVITVIEPKPVKNVKKINFKKTVANKKYSKVPKFEIMEDDEMMMGDEPPKNDVTEGSVTEGSSTSTSESSTSTSSSSSEASSTSSSSSSESSETYETTVEDVSESSDFTEVRTRRETVPAESSTMAMSTTGGTAKKYSHHAKSDFDKHELNLSGKSLGKSHPQIYSPQVMRKEFPRPEVSNITSKKSDSNTPGNGDSFVPPLLLVKSHFPHHTKEYEPHATPKLPTWYESAFNETFENETSTEDVETSSKQMTVATDEEIVSTSNTAASDGVSNAPTTAISTTKLNIEEVSQGIDGVPHEIEKKDHRSLAAVFTNEHHMESEQSVKKQLPANAEISHETIPHPVILHKDFEDITTNVHQQTTSTTDSNAIFVPIHNHEPSSEENLLETHESSLNNADYNAEDFKPNRHRVLTHEPSTSYIKRVLG